MLRSFWWGDFFCSLNPTHFLKTDLCWIWIWADLGSKSGGETTLDGLVRHSPVSGTALRWKNEERPWSSEGQVGQAGAVNEGASLMQEKVWCVHWTERRHGALEWLTLGIPPIANNRKLYFSGLNQSCLYFSHCIRILSITLSTGHCEPQWDSQLYEPASLGGFSPKSQKVTLPVAVVTGVCILHWLPQSPSRIKLQVLKRDHM